MELTATFLPGLAPFVRDELAERPGVGRIRLDDPRSEASFRYRGSLRTLFDLRTVLAPYRVLSFAVPRPRSLLSSEYLPRIAEAISMVRALNPDLPPRAIRIDAAGSDSATFGRICSELESLTGLPRDQDDGNCQLRFRPSRTKEGWEVLVRLSTRPLSLRQWRTGGYPGGLNATIAAAMVRMTRPGPRDRYLNLMCGSGTLLVERMLVAPAARVVGMDYSDAAIVAARKNLRSAGLAGSAQLVSADVRDSGVLGSDTFDVLVSDPPWGDKHGSHQENRELYDALLRRAAELADPGAILVVITHELRLMEALLARSQEWVGEERHQVDAKGHHPHIHALRRA